jgi:hypothetical protein
MQSRQQIRTLAPAEAHPRVETRPPEAPEARPASPWALMRAVYPLNAGLPHGTDAAEGRR